MDVVAVKALGERIQNLVAPLIEHPIVRETLEEILERMPVSVDRARQQRDGTPVLGLCSPRNRIYGDEARTAVALDEQGAPRYETAAIVDELGPDPSHCSILREPY